MYLYDFHHLKGVCITEQMCLQVPWMPTTPARQLLPARTASRGAPTTLSDSGSMPQDTVKSLLASAWTSGADAKQAQQAKLAALRVQAAMLLPGSAAHSKTLPFTKGEQPICDMPLQAYLRQGRVSPHPLCPLHASGRAPSILYTTWWLACIQISGLHVLDVVRWEGSSL